MGNNNFGGDEGIIDVTDNEKSIFQILHQLTGTEKYWEGKHLDVHLDSVEVTDESGDVMGKLDIKVDPKIVTDSYDNKVLIVYHDKKNGTVTSVGCIPSGEKWGIGVSVADENSSENITTEYKIKQIAFEHMRKNMKFYNTKDADSLMNLMGSLKGEDRKQLAIDNTINILKGYASRLQNEEMKHLLVAMVNHMQSGKACIYKG